MVAAGECVSEEVHLHMGMGGVNAARVSEQRRNAPIDSTAQRVAEWASVSFFLCVHGFPANHSIAIS